MPDEAVDGLADDLIDHSGDDGGDVRAVEDLLALLVDDLPLAVGHIVELEDIFTDGEVAALHLGLGALDVIGEHLGGDGGILVHLRVAIIDWMRSPPKRRSRSSSRER